MRKINMADAQSKAKRLVEKGVWQKDVAQQVGVSERTMSIWVKKFGWVRKPEMDLPKVLETMTIKDFMVYIHANDKKVYDQVIKLFGTYIIDDNAADTHA